MINNSFELLEYLDKYDGFGQPTNLFDDPTVAVWYGVVTVIILYYLIE
jgi:hypothetical protein